MFKLNSTIVDRGEEHLRQLYGPSPVDYLAWHWRHFDADHPDMEEPVRMSQLAATLSCAQRLAGEVGIDLLQRPMLLVTDFNVFRHFVHSGQLARVVTLNLTARHIDNKVGVVTLDVFQNIFVDLYLMSRARCLLTSHSGFSKLALWMAGGQLLRCHRDMVSC
ncbi:hypothetical protein PLESTB_000402600 [Pleodorina starrii]|uniref:Uncharacterized protein n=1 Tax=Pleodorina starrii TaxID=330485 RepID=A0A9W6BEJ3_9CHLO|nr:hypothetical protein PLESTB_000402600 [Pleodorina starrii]